MARKGKIRVSFHKNRTSRVRPGDLTHRTDEEVDDLNSGERLSGKGATVRHRTVIGEETDDGRVLIDVDLSRCRSGRVLWCVGSGRSLVQTEDGALFPCTLRRVLRTMSRDAKNLVACGDNVLFLPNETVGVIERLEPRRSELSRGRGRFSHVIAANIDQAVIVTSVVDPPLKPGVIDRFLVSCEKGRVRGIICVNKLDRVAAAEMQVIAGLYARLGYEVVLTSAAEGVGIERLRELLVDKTTVFAGQSGVGKSSLLNRLDPTFLRQTNTVSHETGKGKHTTRVAELRPLTGGGFVIDTPGVRRLELWDVPVTEIEGLFVEFRPFVRSCHFADCTHRHETGCAIQQAVQEGRISQSRFESYLRIVTGAEEEVGTR